MRAPLIVLGAGLLGLAALAAAAPPAALPAMHVPDDGPALGFDLQGVRIGVAEYESGPTGATVLAFDKPVLAAVDVRGGAPGTIGTDGLRLAYEEPFVNAITLAGGSDYGLAVATGVANALKERTPIPGDWRNIAVVPGAIIFDLGGRRYNTITPDEPLGRAALAAAVPGRVPIGARGAGRFAMQGGYFRDWQHSGQGAAFRQSGATKVLVVTVVNAYGSVVDRNGRVLRCTRAAGTGDCPPIAERLAGYLAARSGTRLGDAAGAKRAGATANTTITVVVTNQALPYWALQRLAVQVHNSMARAIQPFGTEYDGDTLFAATTAEVLGAGALDSADLATLASETAWDAILASAPRLPFPSPRQQVTLDRKLLAASVGRYEFATGVVAELRAAGDGLQIEVTGQDSLYLPAGQPVRLGAVGADEFELATPRADRMRLDRDTGGAIVGITINPGPWPVGARRLPPP